MPMFGVCALMVTGSLAATFTDTDGTVHTWTKAKPTIMVAADHAKTLLHMGLPANQINSYYGGRYTYGSNYGGMDAGDGNNMEPGGFGNWSGINHKTAPYDATLWPSDHAASDDPIAIALAGALDLTPKCRGGTPDSQSGWCTAAQWTFDPDEYVAMLDEKGWPDIIIVDIYIYTQYYMPSTITGNATEKGIPILNIGDMDHFWNMSAAEGEKASAYRVKDAWEMMRMWHDLAEALGVENVDAVMEEEKKEFCEAAGRFKKSAKMAHEKGVRAMAGNFPAGTRSPNGEIGAYLTTPDFEASLGLFESLGMPLLHHDGLSYWETTMDADSVGMMSPTDLRSAGSTTEERVPYYVDFWLIDERGKLNTISDKFAEYWPHPAIVQKQFCDWPVWTLVHSYQELARRLDKIATKLQSASKLHDVVTECTDIADTHHTDKNLQTGDFTAHGSRMANTILGPGQYACFKPVTFDWCNGLDAMPEDEPETPEDSAAHGTVVLAAVMLLREFF